MNCAYIESLLIPKSFTLEQYSYAVPAIHIKYVFLRVTLLVHAVIINI